MSKDATVSTAAAMATQNGVGWCEYP